MADLLLAAAFFVGIHLFVSGTSLRDRLVGMMGESAYLGLFSLMSLGGLVWLVLAFNHIEGDQILWTVPAGVLHLGTILVPLALILALAGLTTPNPTAVKGDSLLQKSDPVKGILTVTRHPFQWAVVLWAGFHLLANGQLSTTIFFGAFLVLSFCGTFSIDKKRARKDGAAWEAFAEKTSNVPFAAIAMDRTKLDWRGIGVFRFVGGLVLYGVILWFHQAWFGVSPIPGMAM
ncbi:MAG: NnrU family protein [Alphaproteobacteria bacterium]|nr:MAG: NnrU family protein [Alphaproteobacteria bacterium]